jgi:LysM repeat protein
MGLSLSPEHKKRNLDSINNPIPGKEFCHTVQKGETWERISQLYSLEADDLPPGNPDTKILIPGSIIFIPIVPVSYKRNTIFEPKRYYIVRPGDTLSTISKEKKILLSVLEGLNPQVKNGFSLPGDVVFLA